MKPSNRMLILAAVCSVFCVFLLTIAIATGQIAFSRFGPDNNLVLSQDPFYAISGWAFLLYDLVHVFVIFGESLGGKSAPAFRQEVVAETFLESDDEDNDRIRCAKFWKSRNT
jgi:hypothetical protein